MTLNQVRAVLAAARTGSFTAAAVELGLAQASVSELIRRLDEEQGTQIFVRGFRQLTLTAAGTELLGYAEQAAAAAQGAALALRSVHALEGGVAGQVNYHRSCMVVYYA